MKKIITNKEEKYYWDKGDLHTKNGMFQEKDIKNKSVVELKGEKYYVLDANFQDKIEKISRGPAIIVKKDIVGLYIIITKLPVMLQQMSILILTKIVNGNGALVKIYIVGHGILRMYLLV